MKRILIALWALAVLVTCGGCTCCCIGTPANRGTPPGQTYSGGGMANVFVGQAQSSIVKVAVMPLKAATELIGSSVSDMVVTELSRTQRYQLVERGQMSQFLSETELAMAGLSEAKAVEAAKLLGADGVVIGTVDEYTMQAKGGKTYAVVGLSIRLIDCANGQIIWSADHARMAGSDNTPLASHARAVVRELVSSLYRNLSIRGQGGATMLPPPTPSGVTVSDMGLREATVGWSIPSLSARYRIERANSEEGPFAPVGEAAAQAGRFTDRSGLRDATTYYYRVVPLAGNGTPGEPSDVVETMTAPPPDPPRNVSASAPSSRCISVSWTPPRSEGIREYRVERASANGMDWEAVGTTAAPGFKDGGRAGCDIADSTVYFYRVVAVNVVGAASEPSDEAEVESSPPPAPVPGFSATPDEVRCVPLAWEKSREPGILGYEIERADSPSGAFAIIAKVDAGAEPHYLDGKRNPGNLDDGREYRYRMRSFNNVGAFGEWTEPVPATTRFPPPAPEGVAAAQGMPRSSLVTWEKSPDDKVVSYEVERMEEGAGEWKQVGTLKGRDATSLLDRAGASASAPTGKLTDGTAYLWRVRAVNIAGAKSEWSEAARAVTKVAPRAPKGLATTTDEVGCVKLSWDANEEKDIAEYVVEARAADGRSWKTVSKGSKKCVAEDSGLGNGVARVYRVKAIDANTHESEWSDEAPGSSRPLPDPPRALAAKIDGGDVVVSFEPPRDGLKEFKVYRKKFMGQELLATVAEPPAQIAAPPAGEKIDIFVTAIDERGLESKQSEKITIDNKQ